MSAMDPDCAEFSPGRIHLGMVIKACFERGLSALELMAPAVGYKLEWGDQAKNVDTLLLPFNIKGRIALELARGAAAQARRLSRTLPEFIRKPIVNLLNRPRGSGDLS
jgi:CelD/BcsL family acetyltransferase involved in cellulose biosynthesis